MGQRHQVFVVTKDHRETETEVVEVFAFYAQWSYGSLPIRAVDAVATFIKKAKPKYQDNVKDILEHVLCLDMHSGGYNRHSDITDKLLIDGKMSADGEANNDGITIIDMRDYNNISYCHMFIESGGVEEQEPVDEKNPKIFTAYKMLSAEEYMSRYYNLAKRPNIVKSAEWYLKRVNKLKMLDFISVKDYFTDSFSAKVIKANNFKK